MTLFEEFINEMEQSDLNDYDNTLKVLEKHNRELYSDISSVEDTLQKIYKQFGGISQREFIKDFIDQYKLMINKLITYVDWNKEIPKDDKFDD